MLILLYRDVTETESACKRVYYRDLRLLASTDVLYHSPFILAMSLPICKYVAYRHKLFPIVRCAIIISPTTEGVCTEVVRGSIVLAQLLLLLLGGAGEGGAVGGLREQLH